MLGKAVVMIVCRSIRSLFCRDKAGLKTVELTVSSAAKKTAICGRTTLASMHCDDQWKRTQSADMIRAVRPLLRFASGGVFC
jgi:hypothetical protein